MGTEAKARDLIAPLMALALVVPASACTPDCEEKADITSMEGWTLLEPEVDPFSPPADAALCTAEDINVAPFGTGGPLALDVDTRAGCGWATLSQPTLVDIEAGDGVFARVFYFTQTATTPAVANVALRIGDRDVLAFAVELPTSSDIEFSELTFDERVPAGTTALFHVDNHGDNTWNLLEMSRVRKVFCSE